MLTFFLAGTSVLLPAGMAVLEVSAVWSEQPDEPAELNPMATFARREYLIRKTSREKGRHKRLHKEPMEPLESSGASRPHRFC